jgi:hypothetical protein
MSNWNIHICNARDRLTPMVTAIEGALHEAEAKCQRVHEPVSLDIVVRATDHPMPKELEVSGSSYGPGRIDLGIDQTYGSDVMNIGDGPA